MSKDKKVVADLDKRVEAFNKELKALLGKYELGIGATPVIAPDGRLQAQPNIVDASAKEEKANVAEG